MSTDEKVTADLIETLKDGQNGFDHASKRLADSGRPDLVSRFEAFAAERRLMAGELETMAASYGDDIDEDGSVVASMHRGWMSVKDAVTGADPTGVLKAAVTGEEHAVEEFTDALDQDISSNLRTVVQRQLDTIRSAHADVVALAEAEAA